MSYEKSASLLLWMFCFFRQCLGFAQHAVKGELQMLKQGNL